MLKQICPLTHITSVYIAPKGPICDRGCEATLQFEIVIITNVLTGYQKVNASWELIRLYIWGSLSLGTLSFGSLLGILEPSLNVRAFSIYIILISTPQFTIPGFIKKVIFIIPRMVNLFVISH